MRSALMVALVYLGIVTGYLAGHNEGFEIGKVVGRLDSKVCFLHNGVKE